MWIVNNCINNSKLLNKCPSYLILSYLIVLKMSDFCMRDEGKPLKSKYMYTQIFVYRYRLILP